MPSPLAPRNSIGPMEPLHIDAKTGSTTSNQDAHAGFQLPNKVGRDTADSVEEEWQPLKLQRRTAPPGAVTISDLHSQMEFGLLTCNKGDDHRRRNDYGVNSYPVTHDRSTEDKDKLL